MSSGSSPFKQPYKATGKDKVDLPGLWHGPFMSHSWNDPRGPNHGGDFSVHHLGKSIRLLRKMWAVEQVPLQLFNSLCDFPDGTQNSRARPEPSWGMGEDWRSWGPVEKHDQADIPSTDQTGGQKSRDGTQHLLPLGTCDTFSQGSNMGLVL